MARDAASARALAVAFDPKSPAMLAIPRHEDDDDGDGIIDVDASTGDNDNNVMTPLVFSVDRVLSGRVGCNRFESTALMVMMDARDDETDDDDEPTLLPALRQLSRRYRLALADCIEEWGDDLKNRRAEESTEDIGDNDQDQKYYKDELDLTQLQLYFAVVHLSEIYLLVPSPESPSGDMTMMIMGKGGGHHHHHHQDSFEIPGGVSAETVRYLRLHHLGPAEGMFDDEVVDTLTTSLQPDQWNGGVDYWKLVMAYAIRGCLEDVWELLTHHSIWRRLEARRRRRAVDSASDDDNDNNDDEEEDDYQAQWLRDFELGFEALKCVLLSAPIPGGRNGKFDLVDPTEENVEHQSETEYIDGVPLGAYRLWNKTGASFDPQEAFQSYQLWQETLDEYGALRTLRGRIRPIDQLLSLLTGNFKAVEFESWQDALCADILYKVPNIRPMDMCVRAKEAMGNHGSADASSDFDVLILDIMNGNAGSAIQGLYQFLGGDKGAALPAVTTSLLAQLLSDAEVLDASSDRIELCTDLLIDASSAIRSSLSEEGHDDLGTRLAVQLLLPHVSRIGSDVRITANLVNALEHHSPTTDAEATTLLTLCSTLVERKNIRVLDACSSICLARYSHYLREQRPGGAVHWLFTGMELEAKVLCNGPTQSGPWQRALSTGACYQKVVAYFSSTAQSLLKSLSGDQEGASLLYVRAKEMTSDLDESMLAGFIPEVKVLKLVLTMAEAVVEGGNDEKVASSIVSCLEEKTNDEDDGVVSSLANPCMHWDLLRLATAIVERDVTRDSNSLSPVSSFDVRGIGVLFATLTILKESCGIYKKDSWPASAEDFRTASASFAEGLKRAYIVENAANKLMYAKGKSHTSVRGIYGSNFSTRPREEQERAVKMMLDY